MSGLWAIVDWSWCGEDLTVYWRVVGSLLAKPRYTLLLRVGAAPVGIQQEIARRVEALSVPRRMRCLWHGLPALRPAGLRQHWPDGRYPRTAGLRYRRTKGFGCSVHSLRSARMAARAGADYCLISPVRLTQSHPGSLPLDSRVRSRIVGFLRRAGVAPIALGGLSPQDLPWGRRHGCSGVAGIRGFVPGI